MFISTKNLLRFLRNPSSYPDDEIQATGSGTIGDEIRLYAGINRLNRILCIFVSIIYFF